MYQNESTSKDTLSHYKYCVSQLQLIRDVVDNYSNFVESRELLEVKFTMSLTSVFDLAGEFGDEVRTTVIDSVVYASVYDLISEAIRTKNPRDGFARLKITNPVLVNSCKWFQFPGQGSRNTPIADKRTIMKIIMELPGSKAQKFREQGAITVLKVLFPDEDFIDQLRVRMDDNIQEEDDENAPVTCKILAPERTLQIPSRLHTHTSCYIRVRMPQKYLRSSHDRKQLTLDVIKFGIAYDLHQRSLAYGKGDNGYMLFSFALDSRKEADIVENILKYDLATVTILDSREYVDATKLAALLNIPSYDSSSYESYLDLAKSLFRVMVNKIHVLWPDRYGSHYGHVHEFEEQLSRQPKRICVDLSTAPLDVEVKLTRRTITASDAQSWGMLSQQDENSQLRALIATLKAALSQDQDQVSHHSNVEAAEESVTKPVDDTKSLRGLTYGAVIGRNLKTGVETTLSSSEKAAAHLKISPHCFRRGYIDKARQVNGCHWRYKGHPCWIPPKGLVYNENGFEKSLTGYIRATSLSTDEVRVYESYSAAAAAFACGRRELNTIVLQNKEYLGFKWSILPQGEWGTWENTSVEEQQETGVTGRCLGKVIARDLRNGVDVEYSSSTVAAAKFGIAPQALRTTFLDRQRQLNGYHFRKPGSPIWTPPENLVYDLTKRVQTFKGYVKGVCCDNATDVVFHESLQEAVRYLGGNLSLKSMSRCIEVGEPLRGRIWTMVPNEEVGTMTPA